MSVGYPEWRVSSEGGDVGGAIAEVLGAVEGEVAAAPGDFPRSVQQHRWSEVNRALLWAAVAHNDAHILWIGCSTLHLPQRTGLAAARADSLRCCLRPNRRALACMWSSRAVEEALARS